MNVVIIGAQIIKHRPNIRSSPNRTMEIRNRRNRHNTLTDV